MTPTQIKLGLLYPDSGTSASFSSARAGVDARLGDANAHGGIDGRHVVYDWEDDQDLPSTNSHAARILVDSGQVFGLLEESAAASGASDYLTQKHIPVVGLSSEDVWSKPASTNMFAWQYATSQVDDVYGRIVKQAGGTKAVILVPSDAPILTKVVKQISTSLAAVGVDSEPLALDTVSDPAAAARRIGSMHADAIVGAVDIASFGKIAQATVEANVHIKVKLSLTGYDRASLASAGSGLIGVYLPSFTTPLESNIPAMTRFKQDMAQFAPELAESGQASALQGYVDTDLMLTGLEKAGSCPTRDGFIHALRSTSSYDANGLVLPIDLRTVGKPQFCLALVRVNPTGTAFEVVNGHLCGVPVAS
ncbi:ABC transporter substrate-binding protein [Frankia sp. AgB1.9]|uniref:ABC transporter substrate-binding protein n=1 Tax=unclassified Frankia TaxID=2632575 RepID=UPI0019345D42|nr:MULTISPECIES: ABC transporter substrate-binding protein [unclassified Frankia]MBL7490814.1 ABC transporter substrate-binding protein [Frankia sp. AgW1.1]MBL7552229.1 ABC transporter substrate-binding protein [Frankia sp. AgB1.9]MBL7622012.1 ABC transporter substrate-binding protein [Frankia sp. AgB1.8]